MNASAPLLNIGVDLIEASQWVPRPLDEVFAFFADERNLEALTPPWLKFHVLGKSTPEMRDGTLIDYRLKLYGVPMRWRSRIEDWRPGVSFVDTQIVGPYARWHHLHTFAAEGGGTRLADRVSFKVPLGALGAATAGPFVRANLKRIFGFRQSAVAERFGR